MWYLGIKHLDFLTICTFDRCRNFLRNVGTGHYIVIKIPSIRSLGLICRLTIDTERSKSSRPLAER